MSLFLVEGRLSRQTKFNKFNIDSWDGLNSLFSKIKDPNRIKVLS